MNADLIEAAFREGYDDGWCTGTAAMQEDRAWNCDADWKRSNARAAIETLSANTVAPEPRCIDPDEIEQAVGERTVAPEMSEGERLHLEACAESSCSSGIVHEVAPDDAGTPGWFQDEEARRSSEPTDYCGIVVMDDDAELVEQFARAMFDEWPLHAVSPALAEQSGQEVGSPLTYDKVLEMGGDHNGLLRLAKGAAKLHERLASKPADGLDEDYLALLMLNRLHDHVPEAERPMSLSDLSDEQLDRARKAVRAVIVAACLSKPAGRYANIAEAEAALLPQAKGAAE